MINRIRNTEDEWRRRQLEFVPLRVSIPKTQKEFGTIMHVLVDQNIDNEEYWSFFTEHALIEEPIEIKMLQHLNAKGKNLMEFIEEKKKIEESSMYKKMTNFFIKPENLKISLDLGKSKKVWKGGEDEQVGKRKKLESEDTISQRRPRLSGYQLLNIFSSKTVFVARPTQKMLHDFRNPICVTLHSKIISIFLILGRGLIIFFKKQL